MRMVRVAVCQLECHPALYTDHIAYPEEPFLPTTSASLSRLGTKGVDVQALTELCSATYEGWHLRRIDGVLGWLRDQHADVVLFPEGSIPLAALPMIAQWSSETGTSLLAGTHTFRSSPVAQEDYGRLDIPKKERKRLLKSRLQNVMPFVRRGRTMLVPKAQASPFERSLFATGDPEITTVRPHGVETPSGKIQLLPLICIEALRVFNVERPYDLVGVIAFDQKPDQFSSFVEQQVRNRKVVAFCNDGRTGGSLIASASDERSPNWLRDALPGGLPPGDAILIADIDLDVTAVEVATAAPGTSLRLVRLSSVRYLPAGSVTATMDAFRVLPEPAERVTQLARALESKSLDRLQEVRARTLLALDKRGVASTDQWEGLGFDCVLAGVPPLADLESGMAKAAADTLVGAAATKTARQPDVAPMLLEYLAECRKRSAAAAAAPVAAPPPLAVASPIDREAESRAVHEFLDDKALTLLEVSGLPQIGKTAAIDKGLIESGVAGVLRIPLTSTSSPEYLVLSLASRTAGAPQPPYDDVVRMLASEPLRAALRPVRVLVLEKAHLLFDAGQWRDDRWESLLGALVDVANETSTKLVVETQRELPLTLTNPSVRKRLRISGLNRTLRRYGVSLFDSQLRRVGLDPAAVTDEVKEFVVDKLGGHPVAIALAADVSYEDGADGVAASLRERRGFFLTFLSGLVRRLSLTDEEQTVMRALCLARAPVPRAVALAAVDFPAAPSIRDLIALGAVDVSADGRLEAAAVLRDYFDPAELPPATAQRFHVAATAAFGELAERDDTSIDAAVEAEYHAGVAGIESPVDTRLLDGALGTVHELYRAQRFDEAGRILDTLLARRRSVEMVRLAALVSARRHQFETALRHVREALTRNPRDTGLIAEMTKIALTQFQDDRIAEQLIDIAKRAGVEDEAILVAEGRMLLRRQDLVAAERAFARARQITHRNPWPFFFLGKVYMRAGRVDDAIAVLEEGEEFFYRTEARSRNALNAIRTELGLAYLFIADVDRAKVIIEALFAEDPENPEVVRAYAALTIKTAGIAEARSAFERLSEARIRNRYDRCQFHLLYGMFFLGISDLYQASREFEKAHAADRSNVYVMMKWARTLFDLGEGQFQEGDDSYKAYLLHCSKLTETILRFDPDNAEGIALMQSLHQRFGIEVGNDEA
jgi:tetratricopeptide (TPR) repeat protein